MSENNKPIHQVRIGRIKAAVFHNCEDVPRKVEFTALCKDGETRHLVGQQAPISTFDATLIDNMSLRSARILAIYRRFLELCRQTNVFQDL